MTTLTCSVLAVGATAAPARAGAAGTDGGHVEGPFDAPAAPIDLERGESCAFPVHVEAVLDEVKVLRYYDADGRLAKELFWGDLVSEVTNLDSGASTRVDVSGTAMFAYADDGTTTIYGAGPYLAVFRPGDVPHVGVLRIDGLSKLVIPPDGGKTLAYGTTENLCERID